MSIKILLVEDQIVMREGLRALIDGRDGMLVIGQADNGKVALELVEELKPDIIIMDVAMPCMNGIEATRLIKEKLPNVKILALSAHDNAEYVMGMIKGGVSGYMLKDSVFEELAKAIETVMEGKSYLSPEIATIIMKAQSGEQVNASRSSLSERDLSVIKQLAEGSSARQIAEHEKLSVKTIEGRRRRIMEKLGVESIAELVRYAIEEGLISSNRHG